MFARPGKDRPNFLGNDLELTRGVGVADPTPEVHAIGRIPNLPSLVAWIDGARIEVGHSEKLRTPIGSYGVPGEMLTLLDEVPNGGWQSCTFHAPFRRS